LKDNFQATVDVRACRPARGTRSGVELLVDIRAVPDQVETLKAFLDSRPLAERVRASRVAADRLVVFLSAPMPDACERMTERGGFCECSYCPHTSEAGDPCGPTFLVPSELIPEGKGARKKTVDSRFPRVLRVGTPRLESVLTRRQDEAIREAFQLGYFDSPRRKRLQDVSRLVGSSPHATMELLRRATYRLAARHLHGIKA
jgi:predicted DNA binding protein